MNPPPARPAAAPPPRGRGAGAERSALLGIAALGAVLGASLTISPLLVPLALPVLAVGAACVARPRWIVGLIFAGILFDRVGVTGMNLDDFPVTASKLAVLGGIAAWGVHALLRRIPAVRWHPVLSAMALFVALTAIGVALTDTLDQGKFNLAGLAMMTVLVGLVYVILAGGPLQPLYRFMGVVFTGALLLAVGGSRGGAASAEGAAEAARASGTMGDPNEWASLVLLVTPCLLGGLAADPRQWVGGLRVGMLLLAPLAVLLSMSRTALAVGVLITPAVLVVLRHRRGEVLGCLLAAALGAPLVVDFDVVLFRVRQLLANLQGGAAVQDVSLEERSELLRQGMDVFREHWLIGAGPGNGPEASGYISLTGQLRPVHNTYLEIASEQGLLGLAGVAVFFVVVAGTLAPAWRGARRERDRQRILGAAAGLAALALMALGLGLLTFAMGWLVLGVALSAVYNASLPRDDDPDPP